jgi:hypothetical protein
LVYPATRPGSSVVVSLKSSATTSVSRRALRRSRACAHEHRPQRTRTAGDQRPAADSVLAHFHIPLPRLR